MLVEPEQASSFVQGLVARSAFFDYSVEYTASNPVTDPDWWPSEEVFEGFLSWVAAAELAVREEIDEGLADPLDRERAMRLLQAEVLNSVFGLEARYKALAAGDNQIRKALTLFDQAGELLARRKALAEPRDRRVAQLNTEPAVPASP